jgi:hypothetical protein
LSALGREYAVTLTDSQILQHARRELQRAAATDPD